MTHQEDYTFSKTFVDELILADFDGIHEMFKIIINNAIKAERDQYHQANKYERLEDRLGYVNGFAEHAFDETQDHQITRGRSHLGHSPSAGGRFISFLPGERDSK
jgi:hypothetical protein